MDDLHGHEPGFSTIAAGSLVGKRVTLCVTGSVAAYKAVLLTRYLLGAGAQVQVAMTRAATQFVGTTTFSALTGKPVMVNMAGEAGERHIQLAEQSDLILIAPATADTLAKAATGRAEDLVSALVLCASCPVLCAPAMHPRMYAHPVVQKNVCRLSSLCCWHFEGPEHGEVASGDVGVGRMVSPETLAERAVQLLGESARSLEARHIVVTAGPTAEAIDPVRALTNRSSGKMGFALAARAAAYGAKVTLIAGPVCQATPLAVTRVNVTSALEMQAAVLEALGKAGQTADALIMCAAVADYRPKSFSSQKQKRTGSTHTLELVANPDILGEIGKARVGARPYLMGFALETVERPTLIERARVKLQNKRVDAIVANRAEDALGTDNTNAIIVTASDELDVSGTKTDVAADILTFLADDWMAGGPAMSEERGAVPDIASHSDLEGS